MGSVCRPARGLGHGPAASPPDLISHHQGEAWAAGKRGTSSGCSTAASSCPRWEPGRRARRPLGDGLCLPSRPGTWPSPWPSCTPTGSDLAPLGKGWGSWPAGCHERLQHCSAFLSAITPLEARPPDRFAYQVMIPAHRHARGLSHGPAARLPDQISHHQGEAGAAGQRGAPTVAALLLAPPLDHPLLMARPPDRVAHQVMAPACRPARGLGHRPAAPHR